MRKFTGILTILLAAALGGCGTQSAPSVISNSLSANYTLLNGVETAIIAYNKIHPISAADWNNIISWETADLNSLNAARTAYESGNNSEASTALAAAGAAVTSLEQWQTAHNISLTTQP